MFSFTGFSEILLFEAQTFGINAVSESSPEVCVKFVEKRTIFSTMMAMFSVMFVEKMKLDILNGSSYFGIRKSHEIAIFIC